jgi:NAD(P)-dependent dehydrogenase (short-subunit alcohol dehydrogenase family)
MEGLLEGKTAIVTGGASGLGLASVKRFLKEGAQVVIADIQDELGVAMADELGNKSIYIHTDVTEERAIEKTIAETISHFGRLDIMFNNAGAVGDPSSILEIESMGFDKLMKLDVNSVIFGHKYAARQFKLQGTGGSIITTASVAALQGGWSSVGYATAKHAIVGTVRHAAKELSPFGIRTNAIAPGVIMTPLIGKAFGVPADKTDDFISYLEETLGGKQAMGRYGTMEDVANAALFLASDLSAYINGVFIPIDGGISSYTLSTSDEEIFAVAKDFIAKYQ